MSATEHTDPKLAASLAEIDRAFARMDAERAKLSPEFRARVKASLAADCGECDDYDGGAFDYATTRGLNSGLRL